VSRAALALRIIRAMERDHGCLIVRASAAWGITCAHLHAVLNGRRRAGKRLERLIEQSERALERARGK
jgi:hypothetical protein